ncbi:hypothetical protein RRG08_053895 [Elysia crispata]|uniref:Integrase zinc-binding domain-containing protein n=1 Tax=Elysia crispata TaxID=231223 RepID=A0AAE1DIF3_9GAST|nr:hypothetical protein RRG08_053895 [Elysia crispata]
MHHFPRLQIKDSLVQSYPSSRGRGLPDHTSTFMELSHEARGHQDPERTLNQLQDRCFWLGISANVYEHYRRCQRCQVAKAPSSMLLVT